jgi:hypothetical protein
MGDTQTARKSLESHNLTELRGMQTWMERYKRIHRQKDDLISLLKCFQKKTSRLKYNYQNSEHYPLSRILFTRRRLGYWNLSPSSGLTC